MTKRFLFLLLPLLFYSCSKNHYTTLTLNDFYSGGWYHFTDFKYSGDIQDGLPNGNGVVEYNNGTVVRGSFSNGVLNDRNAEFEVPGFGTINGAVRYGNLYSGEIRYSNGDYYKGEIDNYKPQGKGLYLERNGDMSTGTFYGSKEDFSGTKKINNSETTYMGDFRNGKPQGEVVITDRNGNSELKIYENGTDVTQKKVQTKVSEEIKRSENRQISQIDNEIEQEEKKLDPVKQEIAELEREKEDTDMDRICGCRLPRSGCLHSISYGNRVYRWKNYFDEKAPYPNITVQLSSSASDAAIRRALLKEKDIVGECIKWNADRDNYTGRIESMITDLQNTRRNILREIERTKQKKRDKIRALERDRKQRAEQLMRQERNRMKRLAETRAREREERCAQNPNLCGCQDPEVLRKCAEDKDTSCVCQN